MANETLHKPGNNNSVLSNSQLSVKHYCENIKDKKIQLNFICRYIVYHCLVNMDFCIYIHFLEGRYICYRVPFFTFSLWRTNMVIALYQSKTWHGKAGRHNVPWRPETNPQETQGRRDNALKKLMSIEKYQILLIFGRQIKYVHKVRSRISINIILYMRMAYWM